MNVMNPITDKKSARGQLLCKTILAPSLTLLFATLPVQATPIVNTGDITVNTNNQDGITAGNDVTVTNETGATITAIGDGSSGILAGTHDSIVWGEIGYSF